MFSSAAAAVAVCFLQGGALALCAAAGEGHAQTLAVAGSMQQPRGLHMQQQQQQPQQREEGEEEQQERQKQQQQHSFDRLIVLAR